MSNTVTITLANRDNATYEVSPRRPLLETLREQGVEQRAAWADLVGGVVAVG